MCCLVTEFYECGGEIDGFGDGVHALFVFFILVAVKEAGDEPS